MGWKYYLPEAEQEPEVRKQLDEIASTAYCLMPTAYKVIDPCMGSGHILVYMFDVLVQIYESYGYSSREAVGLILQNNLYGLDIDDRAAQLAYFAVMMKARQYDRRIFSRGIQPHVYAIQESNGIDRTALKLIYTDEGMQSVCIRDAEKLLDIFTDAKEYGSILDMGTVDVPMLRDFAVNPLENDALSFSIEVMRAAKTYKSYMQLLEIAAAMKQKYDVVVTNPPYMGASGMGNKLSDYVKKYYPDTKSDMSTICMEKMLKMCVPNGYMTMINIPVWMFLSSYEKLRANLIAEDMFVNMVHPGRGIFGSDFGTTTFVLRKGCIADYKGTYSRLFTKQGEVETIEVREQQFLSGKNRYIAKQSNFSKIPSSPVAYWISNDFLKTFNNRKVDNYASTNNGFTTGDNNRFLRYWHEVIFNNICFSNKSIDNAENIIEKWFPYNKGGDYRKWYGNNDCIINWKNNGQEIKAYGHLVPRSLKFQFKECVSWNKITSGTTAFRYKATGTMFDVAGLSMFPKDNSLLLYLLALCNSVYTKKVLEVISPTLNCETGHVSSLPVIIEPRRNIIENLAKENISISCSDWDSYETSWDFKRSPLV